MAAKGGHIDFTFLGFKKIGLGWARSKFTLCTRHWQCLSSANLDQLHGQNCPLHGSIFINSHRSTILGKKLALSGKSWGHDPLLVQFLSFSCSFSREICQIYRLAPPPRLGNSVFATAVDNSSVSRISNSTEGNVAPEWLS